jgi:predicted N-acyltransferase
MASMSFDWAWANAYHQHGLNYYPESTDCRAIHPRTWRLLTCS